jgi:hypothetical protein
MTAADLRRKATECREKALGVIQVATDENREFSEDEAAILRSLVGDPLTTDDAGGEAGRFERQAALIEAVESKLDKNAKTVTRSTEPLAANENAGRTLAAEIGDKLKARYAPAN